MQVKFYIRPNTNYIARLNKFIEVKTRKQFFSQPINMQIPQENTYAGLTAMPNNDIELYAFLKEHFEFPSANLNEINDFINEDIEMKKIIYDLPKIIAKELEFNCISMDFMKETDPNEKILEITIYSCLDETVLLEKEETISDGIIDEYAKTENEYIILVDHYDEKY